MYFFVTPPTHFLYGFKFKMTRFFCLLTIILVLVGCKTLKNGTEVQNNTSALKAVSDSQYILRLAPYTSEGDSAFVFEVCQISSPNDGCAIAFLSSIRQPVIFTVREINQHRQSAAEAMAKFVKDNPELAGAVGSAGGAGVAYQVSTKLKEPVIESASLAIKPASLAVKAQVIEMIKDQGFSSFEQAQEAIAARRSLLSEKLGIEIDKAEFWELSDGRKVIRTSTLEPTKLNAHRKAQGLYDYPHVFKQDFVDFFKNKYGTQMARNKTNAKQVLHYATLYMEDGIEDSNQPKIDFGELVDEYRTQLHGRPLLDADMNYQRVIEDLMDPSMAEEFKKYNNLRQVAEDLAAGHKNALQEVFDGPLKRFEVHKMGVSPYNIKDTKSLGTSAVIHLRDFVKHDIPWNLHTNKLLEDTVRLKIALQEHLPNKAAYRAAKKQLSEMSMTSAQAVKKWGVSKRLAKRASVFFVVLAGILAGTAGAKKVFGIGSIADKDESIALRHPSLFETGTDTSPVESVQGIVVQLGEYLNKSGVDIDYFCMPSGCQLLH